MCVYIYTYGGQKKNKINKKAERVSCRCHRENAPRVYIHTKEERMAVSTLLLFYKIGVGFFRLFGVVCVCVCAVVHFV